MVQAHKVLPVHILQKTGRKGATPKEKSKVLVPFVEVTYDGCPGEETKTETAPNTGPAPVWKKDNAVTFPLKSVKEAETHKKFALVRTHSTSIDPDHLGAEYAHLFTFTVKDFNEYTADKPIGSAKLKLSAEHVRRIRSHEAHTIPDDEEDDRCRPEQVLELHDSDKHFAGLLFVRIEIPPDLSQVSVIIQRAQRLKDVNKKSSSVSVDDSGDEVTMLIGSLVVLTIYFVTGVVYYSNVEGALYKDKVASSAWEGLYFTVVTITTVGFGDMGPKTQGSRIFTCIFSLLGLSFVGIALGMVSKRWGEGRVESDLLRISFWACGCIRVPFTVTRLFSQALTLLTERHVGDGLPHRKAEPFVVKVSLGSRICTSSESTEG